MNITFGSAEDIIKKLRDDKILTKADINEGSVIYINGDKTDPDNRIDVEDYIGKSNTHIATPKPEEQKPQEQKPKEQKPQEQKKYKVTDLKEGDIVIYDPSEGVTDKNLLKYTSPVGSAKAGANVSGNGDSVQTIDASVDKITRWYVFKKEGDVITLLSENPGKDIRLKGGQGFLYAEQELHKLASVYGHGKYAKKIDNYTYTIGNPEPKLNELKTLNVRNLNTGARSLSVKDLEEMLGNPSIEQKEELTRIYSEKRSRRNYFSRGFKPYFNNTKIPTGRVYVPTLSGIDETGKSADENKKSNLLFTDWQFCKESLSDLWREKIFKVNVDTKTERKQWIAGRSFSCFKDKTYFRVFASERYSLTSKELITGWLTANTSAYGLRVVSTLKLGTTDITKNDQGEWIIK